MAQGGVYIRVFVLYLVGLGLVGNSLVVEVVFEQKLAELRLAVSHENS